MRFLNSSGYNDPTAGRALASIGRKERRKNRAKRKRRKSHDRISGIGQRDRRTGHEGLQGRPEKLRRHPDSKAAMEEDAVKAVM